MRGEGCGVGLRWVRCQLHAPNLASARLCIPAVSSSDIPLRGAQQARPGC